MDVLEFKNQKEYNNFLTTQKFPPFQQSWEWGEFQKAFGRQVFRFGVKDVGKIQLTAQVIKMPLPQGKSYFYCPRGPITNIGEHQNIFVLKNFFSELQNLARREGVILFRFDPPWPEMPNEIEKEFHFNRTAPIQPQDTLILNLEKSEEELLSQMKPKMRYNIRLAQKKGVGMRVSTDPKDIEAFLKLLKSTYARQIIKPHPDQYYRTMIQTLAKLGMLKLYLAEYQNKPLVANIVITFGQTATYVHGASSPEYKNVMAPHLAQWYVIKEAKAAGIKQFDLFGIAPPGSPKEKLWQGITRFKVGFGGRAIHYAGAFDLPINKTWCKIYYIAKKITGRE